MGFNFSVTDPVLNDAMASQCTDIIGGHLYGTTPSDYPLARSKCKELWMTEHYADNNDGNILLYLKSSPEQTSFQFGMMFVQKFHFWN
ncbi:hypothetical protein H2241_23470 [Pantoea ananatis]|uniref:hypothetical protein n=1 Tax=Pantoea ananas TaxID=553 RepID=UPI00158CC2A1|nr:hypothetical protein [Pantoea ananatis]MBA4823872.1 hypothetical protein [Pantoea ananatis]QKV86008.1 hypothetical protein FOB88_02125 [Pantoea ananatis]